MLLNNTSKYFQNSNVLVFVIAAYCFFVPWEDAILIPSIGTIAKFAFAIQLLIIFACILFGSVEINNNFIIFPFVFFVFVLMSSLVSVNNLSDNSVIRLTQYFFLIVEFYILTLFIFDKNKLNKVLVSTFYGTFFLAILQICSFLFFDQNIFGRVTVGLFDPNDIAMICCIGIAICIYLYVNRNINGVIAIISSISLLSAILLSGSRTGLIGVFVLFIYTISSLKYWNKKNILCAFCLFLFFIALTSSFFPEDIFDRLMTTGDEVKSGDFSDRSILWQYAISLFMENPVFGVGPGNYKSLSISYFGFERSPHNVYLSILAELGVLGAGAFFSCVFFPLLRCFSLDKKDRNFVLILLSLLLISMMSLNWEWRKQTWLVVSIMSLFLNSTFYVGKSRDI